METVYSLTLFGFIISVVTIKLLTPNKNTIVFSKYAYYCEKDNAFLIIYLNTASQFLTNVETNWYFKLERDWVTEPPIKVPFITRSVQTFYLKFKTLLEIVPKLDKDDRLRVGIYGNLGGSQYATYVEYPIADILVIPDRSIVTNYTEFYNEGDILLNPDLAKKFHYAPSGAKSLFDLSPKP